MGSRETLLTSPSRSCTLAAVVLTVGAAAMPCVAHPEAQESFPESFVEQVKDGSIDWGTGSVAAWGRVVDLDSPRYGEPSGQSRWGAVNAAKARLVAILETVSVDGGSRVGERPGLVERVREIVADVKVTAERKGRGRFYEVQVSAPLFGPGGITTGIHQAMASPGGGDSGTPGGGEGSGASAPAGNGPDDAGTVSTAPAPPRVPATEIPAGAPTGILIDTRGTGVAPALLPRIMDDAGNVIASSRTINEADLMLRGIAAYGMVSTTSAEPWDRIGGRP